MLKVQKCLGILNPAWSIKWSGGEYEVDCNSHFTFSVKHKWTGWWKYKFPLQARDSSWSVRAQQGSQRRMVSADYGRLPYPALLPPVPPVFYSIAYHRIPATVTPLSSQVWLRFGTARTRGPAQPTRLCKCARPRMVIILIFIIIFFCYLFYYCEWWSNEINGIFLTKSKTNMIPYCFSE